MIRYTLLYPGDPPMEVMHMSRGEFLTAYPRQPIRIGTIGLHGEFLLQELIPMQPDEVICDLCGGDPRDEVWVYNGMRGYCRSCAESCWFDHLTPNPRVR